MRTMVQTTSWHLDALSSCACRLLSFVFSYLIRAKASRHNSGDKQKRNSELDSDGNVSHRSFSLFKKVWTQVFFWPLLCALLSSIGAFIFRERSLHSLIVPSRKPSKYQVPGTFPAKTSWLHSITDILNISIARRTKTGVETPPHTLSSQDRAMSVGRGTMTRVGLAELQYLLTVTCEYINLPCYSSFLVGNLHLLKCSRCT